eukprot:TRINITY_DN20965_c0_g2_i2.p1 TRINITY_DN20965_c0_g2~~TRINITY_DN20965_c0_g2_i2.p1  ORF type:complete len:106 (+),score=27.84 TRINITY_DN20965_c0_g2_i2:34-351(+)
MDVCEQLNVLATAGMDGAIVLRQIYRGKFLRLIKTERSFSVSHIRVSCRGYIVTVAKSRAVKTIEGDLLTVYTINGERICSKQAKEIISAIVLSCLLYTSDAADE